MRFPTAEERLDLELKHAKPLKGVRNAELTQYVFVPHESATHEMRAHIAGKLLSKAYPGYGWLVRTFRNQEKKTLCRGIQICLGELIEWGGSRTGMYLGQFDALHDPEGWKDETEFELKVKQLGGELLERANLVRGKKKDGLVVDKCPQGFEDFLPKTPKYRIVKNTDEAYKLIKAQLEQNKAAASQSAILSPHDTREE